VTATVLVVMGVSGSGKTAVAQRLAEELGWPFLEGDDLHPEANIAKMTSGEPLTDEDRMPWLRRIATWVEERLDAGGSGVVTCSALKRSYREVLDPRGERVLFVHLTGSRGTLEERLGRRAGHFMPSTLLDSQLETLEEPGPDEPAVQVRVEQPLDQVVAAVLAVVADRDR
jgi:gluconokinase